ncbi:MAG: GerMN domain-containing protein [Clostridiaceae bacterium]|nr:GerMN domain-containing protein [Clostridiaceae bacterium]
MKSHISAEDFDLILEGNISEEKRNKLEKHMTECTECRNRFEILKTTVNYLETDETVDALFTERVVESLRKKSVKRKTSSVKKHGINTLKPIMAFVLVLAFIGMSFYFGTKFGNIQNKTAQGQDISSVPEDTQGNREAPETTPEVVATNAPEKNENVTATLYFSTVEADGVVPEQRELELQDGETLEAAIFRELQKGSTLKYRGSVIPVGTRLLSVETKDGICTLNLSSEFVDNNPGGTAYEAVVLNAIVNSLTELPQVEKVQFLIEGQKRESYTHLVFDEPFERNEDFIKASYEVEAKLRELGENTLKALRDRDMVFLSSIIHPDKKVRFSPYTYVDVEKDLVFSSEEIKHINDSDKVYTWGAYDGSGDPIKLTFEEYLSAFVYDKDFLNAEYVGYNEYIGQGNTINNIFDVYPDGKLLEYYFSGFEPEYEGLDWESLKLIFEEKDGSWYLVGIVHDQWTI